MNYVTLAESDLIQQELGIIILLTIAAAVAIAVRRIKLPYTIALVLVGLMLALFPAFIEIEIGQEVIMAVFVPPLLFDASLHLPWGTLRKNLLPILLIALLGTLIGTLIVGGVVMTVLEVPLAAALAFGALISATDPVAVVAFFRTLGVDKRLTLLVEGESLFNDGVAIVIFNIALATAALTQLGIDQPFSITDSLIEFVVVSGGGLAIGSLLGGVVAYIILKNVDDPLIETAVTVAVAFGSFLLAEDFGAITGISESLHFSGILAVVAAGLFVGNIGRINTSPATKVTLDNFWQFLSFVINSFVFLLIGLKIELPELANNIVPILVAVPLVLVSRAIVVYVLGWLHARLRPKNRIPASYRHVMFWGGLRGAVSLSLALALTGGPFEAGVVREIQVMTFGVVLFTLLVQGLTIESLINRVGLVDVVPQRDEQMRLQSLVYAKRAGQREIINMHEQGIVAADVYNAMHAVYQREIDERIASLADHLQQFPELEQEIVLVARRDALRAERAAISDASRRGLLTAEVQARLQAEIDSRSEALKLIEASLWD